MSFEADLKAHLQADSAIVDLAGDRITPVVRQEGRPTPALVYQIVSETRMNNLAGAGTALVQRRVQLDCWATTHAAARSLGEAVLARMATAAATFSSLPLPGSGLQDYEPDTRLYRRTLEFSCWFE